MYSFGKLLTTEVGGECGQPFRCHYSAINISG